MARLASLADLTREVLLMTDDRERAARAGSPALRRVGARGDRPTGVRLLRQRSLLRDGETTRLRRGALRHRAARRAARRGGARVARLRQPDRRRRPARGRDRARPRLGRRHRRDPLGEARRPDRPRLRPRHDRRDARARAEERARGRRDERDLPQGHHRGRPAAGRLGRRRDLELRHQPLDRQGRRPRPRWRACSSRAAASASRDVVAEDRLSPAERAERGSYVGCIAGALSKSEYEDGPAAAGFEDVSVEFTHQVADGMHGAIVKAIKPV